jgi:hypothetical protein
MKRCWLAEATEDGLQAHRRLTYLRVQSSELMHSVEEASISLAWSSSAASPRHFNDEDVACDRSRYLARARPAHNSTAHMISHRFFQLLLSIAVVLFVSVHSHAEPILSLTFDDPEGTALTVPDAEVASGTGGKAQLLLEKADWVEGSAQNVFQVIREPVMGTKGFLRLINDKQVPGQRGFVITPTGIDTSLAAFSQIENGKVVLNGAIDMFFRYNEEVPSQQELVPHLLYIGGGDGLRLVVEADAGTVAATLVDEKDETVFDTDLDGVADATKAKTSFVNAVPIDPETAYHLAVAFETSKVGVVTAKVFLKAGHGAINPKEDEDLVSQGTFSVITKDSEKALRNGSFSIGAHSRSSPAKVILDLAAFRIFKPAPAIFPDILGKS